MDAWRSIVAAGAVCTWFGYTIVEMLWLSVLSTDLLPALDLTPLQFGAISSVFFYSIVFSIIPAGLLFDHRSVSRWLWVSGALAVLGSGLLAWIPNSGTLFIHRLLGGMANALVFIGGMKIMPMLLPDRAAIATGVFFAFGQLGGLVVHGPYLWFLEAFGWRALLWLNAGVGVMMALALLMLPAQSSSSPMAWQTALKSMWPSFKASLQQRNVWLCGVVAGLLCWPNVLLVGLCGITYLVEIAHLDPTQAGWVLSAYVVGLFIGQCLFSFCFDIVPHWHRCLLVIHILLAIIWWFASWLPSYGWWVMLFLCAGSLAGCQIWVFLAVRRTSPPHMVAMSLSLTTLLMNMTSGLAPVCLGWLTQLLMPDHWQYVGTLLSVGLISSAWLTVWIQHKPPRAFQKVIDVPT